MIPGNSFDWPKFKLFLYTTLSLCFIFIIARFVTYIDQIPIDKNLALVRDALGQDIDLEVNMFKGKDQEVNIEGGDFENEYEPIQKNDINNTLKKEIEIKQFENQDKKPDSNNQEVKTISATSYLVGDIESGDIILSKDKDKILPIASVSKLFSAIVAHENMSFTKEIQIDKVMLETYGESGFVPGDKMKIEDLIYATLMESSNDAVNAISTNYGNDDFIAKMNEYAWSIDMNNTFFADSSGLSAQNVSSANELFLFLKDLYANHKNILNYTLKDKKSISSKPSNTKIGLINKNKLYSDTQFIGGKTGKTDLAKETMVALFKLKDRNKDDRIIGLIVLGSKDRYKDISYIREIVANSI